MKNTTLLILLSLFIISCGDETIDTESLVERNGLKYKVNEQTLFSGKSISYHGNGKIEYEKNYKDGKKHGKRVYYYFNGQIHEEINYKDGKRDGRLTFYHENGQISYEVNYKDGKKHGKGTFYYENGQIKRMK